MTAIQINNSSNLEQRKAVTSELGLVCITFSKQVRFRTMTRTRYLQLTLEQRESALRELYRDNLQRLNLGLSFCQENQIRLYRMSCGLFPLIANLG